MLKKGFLKIKERKHLKKLAAGGTASSKLTSSINQQCRRELSNSSSTRDKRNRHLNNGKPLYSFSWSRGAVICGREFNGVQVGEGECVGVGWKHQLKCTWFIIFSISRQSNFLPCLMHCAAATSEFIFQLLFILELGVSECILPHSNCWQVQPCNHLAPEVMRPNEMELEEINILSLIY